MDYKENVWLEMSEQSTNSTTLRIPMEIHIGRHICVDFGVTILFPDFAPPHAAPPNWCILLILAAAAVTSILPQNEIAQLLDQLTLLILALLNSYL